MEIPEEFGLSSQLRIRRLEEAGCRRATASVVTRGDNPQSLSNQFRRGMASRPRALQSTDVLLVEANSGRDQACHTLTIQRSGSGLQSDVIPGFGSPLATAFDTRTIRGAEPAPAQRRHDDDCGRQSDLIVCVSAESEHVVLSASRVWRRGARSVDGAYLSREGAEPLPISECVVLTPASNVPGAEPNLNPHSMLSSASSRRSRCGQRRSCWL